jgi:adenine-specific DNA-methyltransferase
LLFQKQLLGEENSQEYMGVISDYTNRIIYGDCIDVMKTMPDACVDLIATDPPYLVGYQSRDGRSIKNDKTSDWLVPAYSQMYRVLKDNRFLVSFYSWNKADYFFRAWRTAGFRPVGHLVWVKRYHSNERFVRYCHEAAYLLAKGEPEKPQAALRDVLDWTYTGDTLHPTQKPVTAMLPIISSFSKRGEVVLDPFCGSGTTAVAARSLGRRFIGVELDKTYAQIAENRLRNEEGDRGRGE